MSSPNWSLVSWSALSLVLMAAGGPLWAAGNTTVKAMMHEKLEAAHGVLEGALTEDYAKVEVNATKLYNISKATEWHKPDDADFLYYAKSFQNAAQNLVDQAKAKNYEGVSLGQVRLNLSCMECHKFVRGPQKR